MGLDTAKKWTIRLKLLRIRPASKSSRSCSKAPSALPIFRRFPASQSNISQHLTVLRNARLVDFAQDGSQRCYYVSRPKLVSTVIELLAEGEPAIRKSKDDLDRAKNSSGGACCVR